MAAFAGFKVISVDYRMPPDDPFPAALDDASSGIGSHRGTSHTAPSCSIARHSKDIRIAFERHHHAK
jgi:hypothetical protein